MHAKRVASLTNGVDGVLHAASLGIRAIGQGLAAAQGLAPKHAIKPVDRLLSNPKLGMEALFRCWVPFVVGERKEIFAALVAGDVRVTVVADRGFGDSKLDRFLMEELGFDSLIRFRAVVRVEAESGEVRPAGEWVGPAGSRSSGRDSCSTSCCPPCAKTG